MTSRRIATLLSLPILAAGCAATTANPHPSGTLHGTLVAVGGPAPGATRPLDGTVTVLRGTKPVAHLHAVGGRFTGTLETGTFTVTGGPGTGALCRPATVVISTGSTATVRVVCDLK